MPLTDNDMLLITKALQVAGLDRWTTAFHQEAAYLMTVESSGRAERVWLRPHYLSDPDQIEIDAGRAAVYIGRFASARADRYRAKGDEPPRFASRDEALRLWDVLVYLAAEIPEAAAQEVA